LQTVRAFLSDPFSLSLSRMRPELAMMCFYGDLEGQETIVKRCDIVLVPVPSAAPIWSARETAYEPSRSSVHTESTGRHRGVATAIGAEVASTLAIVSCPYPLP